MAPHIGQQTQSPRRQMRKKTIFLVAGLAFLAGIVTGYAYDHVGTGRASRSSDRFIDIQTAHLRRLDGASSEGRIVFLGSSTFQGLDVSAITPVGLNLSVGGDTLQRLIVRSSAYKSLATARAVVVNIGLNDLNNDCVMPKADIRRLFGFIPTNTHLVIVGLQEIPYGGQSRPCQRNELPNLISGFNSRLLHACEERAKCRYVNNPISSGMDDETKKAMLEPDGIHLSPLGYIQLRQKISQALSKSDAASWIHPHGIQ